MTQIPIVCPVISASFGYIIVKLALTSVWLSFGQVCGSNPKIILYIKENTKKFKQSQEWLTHPMDHQEGTVCNPLINTELIHIQNNPKQLQDQEEPNPPTLPKQDPGCWQLTLMSQVQGKTAATEETGR